MGWFRQILGLERDGPGGIVGPAPMAMSAGAAGFVVDNSGDLDNALRHGNVSKAGQPVNERTALKVATVFACLRIRTGALANTPLSIKRRIDERTRVDAIDNPVWAVMNRRPNVWQTPSQFKRMMEGHLLLRGNAYAVKVYGVGQKLIGLIPLHPDRVVKRQRDDNRLEFVWTRKDGGQVLIKQEDMFHLVGLTLDGVNGLSVLSYAREAIGLSLAQEAHGATTFRNGANVSGALKMPEGQYLPPDKIELLRGQMDEYRSGGAKEGKVIVLEGGLEFQQMALSAEDAQWLESREYSRTDVCMFFGVQPHLVGITAGTTQLGSSIEAMGQGFQTYTLEDSYVTWEEAIGLQCLDWDRNPDLYARFNRNALVRADFKTRWEGYVKGLQWGVWSPNDVRALEDENPREGGDIYYPPPNMTATKTGDSNVDS
jgi:HK97 family phage portal protein